MDRVLDVLHAHLEIADGLVLLNVLEPELLDGRRHLLAQLQQQQQQTLPTVGARLRHGLRVAREVAGNEVIQHVAQLGLGEGAQHVLGRPIRQQRSHLRAHRLLRRLVAERHDLVQLVERLVGAIRAESGLLLVFLQEGVHRHLSVHLIVLQLEERAELLHQHLAEARLGDPLEVVLEVVDDLLEAIVTQRRLQLHQLVIVLCVTIRKRRNELETVAFDGVVKLIHRPLQTFNLVVHFIQVLHEPTSKTSRKKTPCSPQEL